MPSPPQTSSGTSAMVCPQGVANFPGQCFVCTRSQSSVASPTQQSVVEMSAADRDAEVFTSASSKPLGLTNPLSPLNKRKMATKVGFASGGCVRTTKQAFGFATTAGLNKHEETLQQHQCEIDTLRTEAKVLRDCLVHAGSLESDTFAVRLHAERFASVLRSHPVKSDANLVSALGAHELAFNVAIGAGPLGIEALWATSRGSYQLMASVESDLRRVFSKSLLVVGGIRDSNPLCTAERFDPAVGVWESLPPMGVSCGRSSVRVLAGCLYVCSNQDGWVAAERFDSRAESWVPLAPMASKRLGAGIAALGRHLYVCGVDEDERDLDIVERFDPAIGKWELLPSSLVSRKSAAMVALSGCLYRCGGLHDGVRLNSAESFDPKVDKWKFIAPMSAQRGCGAAAAVRGKLYVCGGTHPRSPNAAERYDPDQDVWEEMPPLAESRSNPTVAATGGKLYVYGGLGGGECLSSVERFDPVAWAWEMLPPMSVRKVMATAVMLDGKLYVCGGCDGMGGSGSVERFDPERGAWELLPPLCGLRCLASACVIRRFAGFGAGV
eukprot:TRINITY_DN1136_c0_g2_i1.p1 TRINITY_DN1136_c0_g2~~TRINITY_DN1136_c0_g2_i1.p1  ORF type:complete len:553 (+),score=69.69 TRINITY_DN1136_c0_g2_i1:84-1742(+)